MLCIIQATELFLYCEPGLVVFHIPGCHESMATLVSSVGQTLASRAQEDDD